MPIVIKNTNKICVLPKKIKRTEAKVDELVAKRLMEKHTHRNWLLEVKMKGGRHLQHQKVAAKQVENGKFLWKPPDMGARNPGDYIYLGDADAIYCVVDGRNVHCEVNSGTFSYKFKI